MFIKCMVRKVYNLNKQIGGQKMIKGLDQGSSSKKSEDRKCAIKEEDLFKIEHSERASISVTLEQKLDGD